MKNGFVFTDEPFEFTGATQMSIGAGLDLSQRFAYDYSKRAQSITFRKRSTAKTGSVQITFNHTQVSNIFDEISKYEEIAGQVGEFWWNGRNIGKYLIKSVQISLAIDGIDIISSVQIGLDIQEGYEKKTTTANPKADYRLL